MYAGGGNTNVSGSERGPGGANGGASGGAGAGATGAGAHVGAAFSNALAEANDLDALVFEFGTAKCKFGYAGEDFPRVYESALSSSSSSFGDAVCGADLHNEIERADAAVQAAARMELESEQLAQWLFDTASSRLQTRMSDHPLLFVERPFPVPEEITALRASAATTVPGDAKETKDASASANASAAGSVSTKKQHLKNREQMVEVLMEQLGIPALFCAKSAVLTCYANARTSGLVVEMGATYTSVTSVHEGYAFAHPKSQTHVFGGHDLDAFLRMKLEHQFKSSVVPAVATSPSQEIARRTAASRAAACWSYAVEAKESGLCRVADGAFDEVQNAQLPMINYELPDKTVIAMGTERFSVPEQYFISATSPSAATSPSHPDTSDSSANPGIVKTFESERVVKRGISVPEFVCEVGGMTTEAELRKELFQNIILTGGSSCFENMPTRLEREVVNALSTYQLPLSAGGTGSGAGTLGGNLRVKVIAAHAQERKIGAFLGGSILASLGSFHEMWMSKAEYAEHGAALIHKKCP